MKQPPHKREDGEILGFYLAGDLPEGQALVLNTRLGTFAHLGTTAERRPALLREEQMTDTEQRLLRPLLEHYPYYCPHEVLFAHFYNGSVNEQMIARARERLQEALFAGVWDQEMRLVRNAISRVRLKIQEFDLEVLSLLETGYMLHLPGSAVRNGRP